MNDKRGTRKKSKPDPSLMKIENNSPQDASYLVATFITYIFFLTWSAIIYNETIYDEDIKITTKFSCIAIFVVAIKSMHT